MTETVQRYSRGGPDRSLLVPHLRVGEHVRVGVSWARTACGIDIYHTHADKLSTTDRERTRCQECYDATSDQAGLLKEDT